MPAPKSLGAYDDIRQVLDAALRMDKWPVVYTLQSVGAATHWRQRANAFRVRLRQIEELQQSLPKGTGTSPYDGLSFSLTGTSITITKLVPSGLLHSPEGPIDLTSTSNPDDDFGVDFS